MISPMSLSNETTEVIISGGGPTGVILSALLGHMRVPNVVLEREAEITTDPRGIALDEDGIRVLQAVGVYDRIFSEIGTCMQKFFFLTVRTADLMKKPLTCIDYNTSEGGTGHVGFICHKQPTLERSVRDVIAVSEHSEIRSSATLSSIEEDEDRVTATYTDNTGQTHTLRASFLVGADGKTGFVRKKYLEPKGVLLSKCGGTNYEEVWVALNWQISLPTEKTHPDFALWRLGYSPQQVYDLFFPINFRFLCNPDRPSVCGRFGLPEDRLWRFEFVVHEGEDGQKMASPEETAKIIYPYITHPPSRYGLSQPVRYPIDWIKTLRSRPFSFVARSCNRWALNRVIICGDAAHVFPPFGGQGIASGFRDSSALAWRLALAHRHGKSVDHEKLFEGWYNERKQQFDRSLAATITNGEYVTESNPLKCFIREWHLWAMQKITSWRRELEKGPRAAGMCQYNHQPGFAFVNGFHGGLLLPQVYAYDLHACQVKFSDDLVFSKDKRGLLQLLLLPDSEGEIHELLNIVVDIERDSSGQIKLNEATILIQDLDVEADTSQSRLARIASAEEFAQSRLCKGRPSPQYYDPLRIRKELARAKVVIVRPDRFIYAAVSTKKDLTAALQQQNASLHLRVDSEGFSCKL